MSPFLSPLRYPGGKARFSPFISSLIRVQIPRSIHYAEPFAGGAGAALRLLADEVVRTVFINDLSPGIAAFWRALFSQPDIFSKRVENAKVTVDEWYAQRRVFLNPGDHDDMDLGFATFFMNRCNRSGILGARPIGGLNQDGKWKIDARFNRADLADRIRFLGSFRRRVHVSQLDGRAFLSTLEEMGSKVFVYVDPPYIGQGDDLYLNSLTSQDHAELARQLVKSNCPWMLTYDVHDKVSNDLYDGLRIAQFSIKHTAQKQHVGRELLVFSPLVKVESIQVLNNANATWIGS